MRRAASDNLKKTLKKQGLWDDIKDMYRKYTQKGDRSGPYFPGSPRAKMLEQEEAQERGSYRVRERRVEPTVWPDKPYVQTRIKSPRELANEKRKAAGKPSLEEEGEALRRKANQPFRSR